MISSRTFVSSTDSKTWQSQAMVIKVFIYVVGACQANVVMQGHFHIRHPCHRFMQVSQTLDYNLLQSCAVAIHSILY